MMVPIYRSDGEWVAVYINGHVLNVDGEWIGFVVGREVYDPSGVYVGFLSDDRRLLRKRSLDREPPHYQPPPPPERAVLPPVMPLAPLFRSLPYQILDVFEAFPEKLLFVSETRADMD
jgi:hypothetical protein